MGAPASIPDKDWRKAGRLADRARLWAERCIAETAYTYSYETTTRRWDQARQRALDAEQKMLKAFSELTDLAASKTRGEAPQ